MSRTESGMGTGPTLIDDLKDMGRSMLSKLGRHIRRLARDINRGVLPTEIAGSEQDGVTYTDPNTGTVYRVMLASDAVPGGRIWEVRALRIVMGGSPFAASQSGTAYVFASSQGSSYLASAWKDTATLSLIRPAFYSAGQMVLYPGERLGVLVGGATTGQHYQFSATVMGYDATVPEIVAAEV